MKTLSKQKFINVDKLREKMKNKNIDTIIAVSPENVLYSSGADIHTQHSIRKRLALTVFSQEHEPTMIVCNIEEGIAKKQSWIEDIQIYTEFKETPIDILVKVLKEKGLEDSKIAIEKDYLTVAYYEELLNKLGSKAFLPADSIFDELRAIKNESEINNLRHASTVTREIMDEVFSKVKPGDTEKEISNQLIQAMYDAGADSFEFLTLSTGKRSLIPHLGSEDVPLKAGDIVKVDFGGKFNGYYSDVARTYLVEGADDRKQYIMQSIIEIHKDLIKSAQIGVTFADLFNLCKKLFEEKELPFDMPHLGHSMGIGLHEEPVIHPFNHDTLEENMIINIEPRCRDHETQSGYHLEDLIRITKEGPEILTGALPEEICFIK